MTFHARLTSLINASTNEDGSVHEIYRQCLKEYLINHAEAIRDLVVAAEKIFKEHCRDVDDHRGDGCEICEALAKLEES